MNRRGRRRAKRFYRRPPARRPLGLVARLLLSVGGVALIVGGIVLAAQGAGMRGGRVIGAIAVIGFVLLAVAWQDRILR